MRITKKAKIFSLVFLCLVIISVLTFDLVNQKKIENNIHRLKLIVDVKPKDDYLYLTVKANRPLAGFSKNQFLLYTDSYQKFSGPSTIISGSNLQFLKQKQDLYYFKIKDNSKDSYNLRLTIREGESIASNDGLTIAIQSSPYSFFKSKTFISQSFKGKVNISPQP